MSRYPAVIAFPGQRKKYTVLADGKQVCRFPPLSFERTAVVRLPPHAGVALILPLPFVGADPMSVRRRRSKKRTVVLLLVLHLTPISPLAPSCVIPAALLSFDSHLVPRLQISCGADLVVITGLRIWRAQSQINLL